MPQDREITLNLCSQLDQVLGKDINVEEVIVVTNTSTTKSFFEPTTKVFLGTQQTVKITAVGEPTIEQLKRNINQTTRANGELLTSYIEEQTKLDQISFDAQNLNLNVGDTALVTAYPTPSNASISGLSWSTKDTNILQIKQENEKQVRITCIGAGTAELTAMCKGISNTVTILAKNGADGGNTGGNGSNDGGNSGNTGGNSGNTGGNDGKPSDEEQHQAGDVYFDEAHTQKSVEIDLNKLKAGETLKYPIFDKQLPLMLSNYYKYVTLENGSPFVKIDVDFDYSTNQTSLVFTNSQPESDYSYDESKPTQIIGHGAQGQFNPLEATFTSNTDSDSSGGKPVTNVNWGEKSTNTKQLGKDLTFSGTTTDDGRQSNRFFLHDQNGEYLLKEDGYQVTNVVVSPKYAGVTVKLGSTLNGLTYLDVECPTTDVDKDQYVAVDVTIQGQVKGSPVNDLILKGEVFAPSNMA